jgi:hypothetical protein
MALACGKSRLTGPGLLSLMLLFLKLRRFVCTQELQLSRIIGFADGTFQPEPVIARHTAAVAVIAEYIGAIVTIFLRHGLFFDVSVQPSKLTLHVRNALGADGTLVAGVAPIGKACFVNAVAASHECNGLVGGEHVFSTDGAIALGAPFDAFMGAFGRDRHAGGACLAVEEVLPQPFAESTDTAVITVIDRLVRVVVPQFADVTIVMCRWYLALLTHLANRLWGIAEHAEHVFRFSPRESMVLCLIMAEPTCIPSLTSAALQLDIPHVMNAAKRPLGQLT